MTVATSPTRLFEILEHQGRSKSWFAKQMGMNRTQLYQVVWGERPVPDGFIDRAALILGVPTTLFFLPCDVSTLTETVSESTKESS